MLLTIQLADYHTPVATYSVTAEAPGEVSPSIKRRDLIGPCQVWLVYMRIM